MCTVSSRSSSMRKWVALVGYSVVHANAATNQCAACADQQHVTAPACLCFLAITKSCAASSALLLLLFLLVAVLELRGHQDHILRRCTSWRAANVAAVAAATAGLQLCCPDRKPSQHIARYQPPSPAHAAAKVANSSCSEGTAL